MTEVRPPLPPFTRESALQRFAPPKMAGTAATRKSGAGLYGRQPVAQPQ